MCAALADPLPDTGQTVFGDAPIGQLQPRAPEFLPDSAAGKPNRSANRISTPKMKKQVMELDKKLNVYRCGEEHR